MNAIMETEHDNDGELVRRYHNGPDNKISCVNDTVYKLRRTRGKCESDYDILCPGDFLSKLHSEISRKNDAFWIKDLKSTNGTFLNGVKLTEYVERELRFGDTIGLGVSHLTTDPKQIKEDPNYFIFDFIKASARADLPLSVLETPRRSEPAAAADHSFLSSLTRRPGSPSLLDTDITYKTLVQYFLTSPSVTEASKEENVELIELDSNESEEEVENDEGSKTKFFSGGELQANHANRISRGILKHPQNAQPEPKRALHQNKIDQGESDPRLLSSSFKRKHPSPVTTRNQRMTVSWWDGYEVLHQKSCRALSPPINNNYEQRKGYPTTNSPHHPQPVFTRNREIISTATASPQLIEKGLPPVEENEDEINIGYRKQACEEGNAQSAIFSKTTAILKDNRRPADNVSKNSNVSIQKESRRETKVSPSSSQSHAPPPMKEKRMNSNSTVTTTALNPKYGNSTICSSSNFATKKYFNLNNNNTLRKVILLPCPPPPKDVARRAGKAAALAIAIPIKPGGEGNKNVHQITKDYRRQKLKELAVAGKSRSKEDKDKNPTIRKRRSLKVKNTNKNRSHGLYSPI